uniref:Uncharacterized protein n=1 Tax=Vespula pensylvanica TaxID=30213 RepID=A0A834PB91_VESPE|nr:hypothetical protein H0235_003103 [Vespula pensylvanica]
MENCKTSRSLAKRNLRTQELQSLMDKFAYTCVLFTMSINAKTTVLLAQRPATLLNDTSLEVIKILSIITKLQYLLQEMPLRYRNQMYQHNNFQVHYTVAACHIFDRKFPERWVGSPRTSEDIRQRIVDACLAITANAIERIKLLFICRLRMCIATDGSSSDIVLIEIKAILLMFLQLKWEEIFFIILVEFVSISAKKQAAPALDVNVKPLITRLTEYANFRMAEREKNKQNTVERLEGKEFSAEPRQGLDEGVETVAAILSILLCDLLQSCEGPEIALKLTKNHEK